MATSGKPLTDAEIRETRRLRYDVRMSIRETAKAQGVSTRTVQKHAPPWPARKD